MEASTDSLDSWKIQYEAQVQNWRSQSAEAREKAEKERLKWEAIRAIEREEAAKRKAAGIVDDPPPIVPGTKSEIWDSVEELSMTTGSTSFTGAVQSETFKQVRILPLIAVRIPEKCMFAKLYPSASPFSQSQTRTLRPCFPGQTRSSNTNRKNGKMYPQLLHLTLLCRSQNILNHLLRNPNQLLHRPPFL